MSSLRQALWSSVSGMKASQSGLAVVSHNLANADTEGYSRQSVSIGARAPTRVMGRSDGFNTVGSGAQLNQVTRAHSSFLEKQLIRDRLAKGFYSGKSEGLELFERTFDTGATPTINDRMDTFFNRARELSQDPSRFGIRRMFVDDAQEVAKAFRDTMVDAHNLRESIDDSLTAKIERINTLAQNIALSNERVGAIESTGNAANDFRDERERMIRELSDLMDVKVNVQESGRVDIDVANGFSLVSGSVVTRLELRPDADNAGLLSIHRVAFSGNRTEDITSQITQGEVGGILDVRDNVIGNQMAEVNRLANAFIEQVNAVHRAGFGLDGVDGRDLFVTPVDPALAASTMAVDAAVVADPNIVAASAEANTVPGDNRNLLALADVQETNLAALGGVTLNHFFSELTRDVGYETSRNRELLEMHEVRYQQSESLRESIQGVSVDEEMIDLTRFQKHFEASARVMATVNRLADEVLRLMG